MDALHGLDVPRIVPALRARHDRQPLALGQLGRGDHGAYADRVHRDRLLHEDVLAGLDRRPQVLRPKARRRRENDQVHVRREDLLVGVEPDETMLARDPHLVAKLAQLGAALVQPVLEQVAQRDDLDVRR